MSINNEEEYEKAMAIIDFLFGALDLAPNEFYAEVMDKVDRLIDEIEEYEMREWKWPTN